MTRSISGPSRSSTARSSARASASSAAGSTARRGARESSTISVRTGGFSSSAIGEVVVGDLVATVAIVAVAAPPGRFLRVVAADELAQALEALEMRRRLGGEVEQDAESLRRLLAGGDEDGRIGGDGIVRRAVRHEGEGLPGPEHLVDAAGEIALGGVDHHARILARGLGGEAAGDLQAVVGV